MSACSLKGIEHINATVFEVGDGVSTGVRVGDAQRDITFTTTFVRSYDGELAKLDRLRQLAEAGAITPSVAAT